MATPTEMKTKIAKLPINLDRMDGIVNGPASGPSSLVDVDSGQVKTLARLAAEAAVAAGVSVRYDLDQALSDIQKARARDNIGAVDGRLVVTPESLGAVSGVDTEAASTLNIAALDAAAAAGAIVDGGGRTFAIHGRWTPTVAPRLRNIKFKQIATTGSDRAKTIRLANLDGVEFVGVSLDLGGVAAPAGVTFSEAHGISVYRCSNLVMSDVLVTNGFGHTGVLIEECSDPDLDRVRAADFEAMYAAEPTDDVMQGVSIVTSTNVRATRCGGVNLTANWPGRPVDKWRRYSRGFSASSNTRFHFDAPFGHFVDQGVDITGGANSDGLVTNVMSFYCSMYGYKLANRQQYILTSGFLIVGAGWQGVYVRGFADTSAPVATECDIQNGLILDTGANSIYSTSRVGLYIQQVAAGSGYPAGIRVKNVTAIDRQTVKTMDYGFVNAVTAQAATSGVPVNTLDNWRSVGHITAGQSGFNFPDAKARNAIPQDFANNTLAKVTLAAAVRDTSGLFDATNSRIYVKKRGMYAVRFRLSWEPSATGRRDVFFYKNGSEWDSNERILAPGTSGDNTIMAGTVFHFFEEGDYVELFARHTAGAMLRLAAGAILQIVWVGEA